MMQRTIAIRLKIPDNEAYTARAALHRLGVPLDALERANILVVEDRGDPATLADRVKRDETLFNPNKHELELLDGCEPREGEAWIAPLDARDDAARRITGIESARRYTGWRLFTGTDAAPRSLVQAAVERLLCNPAIESATVR